MRRNTGLGTRAEWICEDVHIREKPKRQQQQPESFSFFMRKLFSHHRRHVFFIMAPAGDEIEKLSRRADTQTHKQPYVCGACIHVQKAEPRLILRFSFLTFREDRLMLVFAVHMLRRESCG